jgi:hypothetical protein
MRTRLIAVMATGLLAVAGCTYASGPDGATPSSSPSPDVPTSAPSSAKPVSNTAHICDTLVHWAAVELTDKKDPVTAKFVEMIENSGSGLSTEEKVDIRQAYYRKQESTLQSLAATATDPRIAGLLGTYADNWGKLAKDTSDDGPDRIQPDRAYLDTACPGIEQRIEGVSEAGGGQ